MTGLQAGIVARIIAERQRQVKLVATGKILHDCAEPRVDAHVKMSVLTEEVGEVARALLECNHVDQLETELIQVAAVAFAWIEAIHHQRAKLAQDSLLR